jgi:hypothetical protein
VKKIITPAQKEEAVYYSDFKGRCFGLFEPPVKVKIEFGYGSERDGQTIVLDLTDEEIQPILDLIRSNLIEQEILFTESN